MSQVPGNGLNEAVGQRRPVPELDAQITEAPWPGPAPLRQQSPSAAGGTGEADEVVSAEPSTGCIGPRIIRLEGGAAGVAPEFYPVPARVKHPATNSEFYSICPKVQKIKVFVLLDRGAIPGPGTMAGAAHGRVAFFLLDDLFSDKPCANNVC